MLSTSVDRNSAIVDVNINYSNDQPIATFRSMWVKNGNCDVECITIKNNTMPIGEQWNILRGNTFFFHRVSPSIHNKSSPDILIEVK